MHLHYLPILDFPSHHLSTISFLINLDWLPQYHFRIFLCFYTIQGVAKVCLESEPLQNNSWEEKSGMGGWVNEWKSLRKGEKARVNHVIPRNDQKVKWLSCSNLSTSHGSRCRQFHIIQVWVVSCDFIFLSNYDSRIIANVSRVRFFPLLRMRKALSVCGGVLVVIKHFILLPTCPNFCTRLRR
jgi:hypothetical protein